MRALFAVPVVLAAVQALTAQAVQAPFNQLYSIRSLGPIPGLTTNYGAITFSRNDPNLLLCSTWNVLGTQNLQAIAVARNAQGHVTGFTGPLTPVANAERIDGGLDHHPSGVLFYTRYNNEVGQIKPGSTAPDRTDPLITPTTVGGLAVVPASFPGAGHLKTLRWPSGTWTDATLTPDGNGTFNLVGEVQTALLPNGPDGFLYVPVTAPLFTAPSILVAEYSGGRIVTYQVDANGDPIVASRAVVVDLIAGAFALTVDPVTLDVLHVNWNSSTIDVIEGFGLACGQCSHYGTGLAGTGAVTPVISSLACALHGQTAGIHVDHGQPNAVGLTLLGFTQQAIPVFGGTILNEVSFSLLHVLDAGGTYRLPLSIPAGVSGFTVQLQSIYFDAGAAQGISMSDGLSMPIL